MPESTCLHIQGRESGPIRVVELPWISVRIGRAAYCEVQLAEFELADEACRLQLRGRSWHLVPVAARSLVSLEGRPVVSDCQLPFDVPFTIGPYSLTLRRDRAAEPDWEMYQGPAPPRLDHSAPMRDAMSFADADPARAARGIGPRLNTEAQASPAPVADTTESMRQPSSQGPSVKDRWEARWRAAGAELKARTERTRTAGEAERPDYGTRFDSVPLKQPRATRAHPPTPPKIDPTIRPIPTPVSPKADATWISPSPEAPIPSFALDVPTTGRIAPERQIETPPHPFEGSDFDDRLEQALSNAVDHDPEPTLVSKRAPDASAGVDRPGVQTQKAQEDAKPVGLDEGDRGPGAVAAEAELADSFPDIVETSEIVGHDRQTSAVIDSASARDDQFPQFDGSGRARASEPSRPVAAADQGPIDNRRELKKRKSAAAGARLIGKSSAQDKPRSSRRESNDYRPAETDRAASSPSRQGVERRGLDSGSSSSERSHEHVEWPSAQEILATHRVSPDPPAPRRTPVQPIARNATQTAPTSACPPSQWTLPLWIAWPPVAALVLCVGVVGCSLCWTWGSESYSAGIVTNRLILADTSGRRTPLPDSVAPPRGTWMETSAQHLAHWAIYLGRVERQKDVSPDVIRDLLTRALQVSPINPTARLALAQLEPPSSDTTTSIRGLGLSRDPLALAWSGRRLLAAGKKEAALNLYRQAIEVASRGEFSQIVVPQFNDDPGATRYLLPGEERIRAVVRELVARNEWTVREWSVVLPPRTLAALAAARLLREQARNDVADALLGPILNQPRPLAADGPIDPLALATRAEAFALLFKWQEADDEYRAAVELLDDETLKRSWWFNLADVAFRLADDVKRQSALRATLTVAGSDDISRRATEILRATNTRPGIRSNRVKAN